MKRAMLRVALAILVLLTVTYAGDYISLRYQIPGGRTQFGQVNINTLYVIHVKAGKIQYEPGQPETDTCVHSLFPHFGDTPC